MSTSWRARVRLNRATNMVDGVGTANCTYNAGGHLWTEDGPGSNDTVTNTYLNRLNQYEHRIVPGAVDILGVAAWIRT